VLAWAGSFGDGLHRSIPAPGLGLVAAACGGAQSPLGRALVEHGLSADDIAVVYKHDTSTQANDLNEGHIHHVLQEALGRTPGNPLWVVSQKAITGHAKGGSAAWQAIGLLQALVAGRIGANPNLDCVDEAMRPWSHLAYTDRPLRPVEPLRAGLLTSLGFGHVNAIALLVHPDAFRAALSPEQRPAWEEAAAAKLDAGRRGWEQAMMGLAPAFRRQADRRFDEADPHAEQAEIAMLLDPAARLVGGRYRAEMP
jgi:fatty acid synthase